MAADSWHHTEDNEDVSIHILNDDCLTHIFSFLPIIDKVRIERVCKRWKNLSQDSWRTMKSLDLSSSTWGFLESFDIHQIRIATLRKILLKCGKYLTQINLSIDNSLEESTLTIVGKLCPNLTNIDVTDVTICASGINALASNCKNISRFCLGPLMYNCENELRNLFKINKNLKYLYINNLEQNIEDKHIFNCLLYLPAQMCTLILDNFKEIPENHFSTVLKHLKNLKNLGINNCHTNCDTEPIYCKTAPILKVIGEHCKSLNKLGIIESFCIGLEKSAEVLHLTKLVNLKVLKCIYCLVSDEFLINIAQQCQQLTYLDITGSNWDMTDIGLAAIATLPKLEKLIISHAFNITGKGLRNMCSLKELECQNCISVSDQAMSMCIKSSPYLQLLDISGCKNITNVTLDAAKVACNTRSNNLMLKMIISKTAIILTKEDKEQVPSLLQIVNMDLYD